jgi:hypothetical protein
MMKGRGEGRTPLGSIRPDPNTTCRLLPLPTASGMRNPNDAFARSFPPTGRLSLREREGEVPRSCATSRSADGGGRSSPEQEPIAR